MQHVPGLDYIRWNPDDGLAIGAMATVQDIEQNADVRSRYPALAAGATAFAGVQVRNLATVAGNVCNASPAGDTLPALLAYNAQCLIVSSTGQRWLPLDELFVGPGQHRSERPAKSSPSFVCPRPRPTPAACTSSTAPGAQWTYPPLASPPWSACPMTEPAPAVRIALGAVAPTPMRAYGAEGRLVGQQPHCRQPGRSRPPLRPGLQSHRRRAQRRRLSPGDGARVLTERTLRHAVATAGNAPDFADIRRLAVQTAW